MYITSHSIAQQRRTRVSPLCFLSILIVTILLQTTPSNGHLVSYTIPSSSPTPSSIPSPALAAAPKAQPHPHPHRHCLSPPTHICYSIDESGSIPSSLFSELQSQVTRATTWFSASTSSSSSSQTMLFAAVFFSSLVSHSSGTVPFTRDVTSFNVAVSSHFQARGGTSLGAGLRACKTLYDDHMKSSMNATSTSMSKGMDMEPSALFVVLTDGQDNAAPSGVEVAGDIRREATKTEDTDDQQDEKENDITIAAVGVGPHVIGKELEQIVDRKRLYVAVEKFEDVAKALVRVVHRACPPKARSWRRDMLEKAMGDQKAMDRDEEAEAKEEEDIMPTPIGDVDDDKEEEEEDVQPMGSYPAWEGSQAKRGRAGHNKKKKMHKKKGRCHKHGYHMMDSMASKGKNKYMCSCPCQCGSK